MNIGLALEIAECEMDLYIMEVDGNDDTLRYSNTKERLESAQRECMTGMQIVKSTKDN